MIVVSDTSPLNYLIAIQEIEILPALYQRVLIPETVAMELKHPRAPAAVRQWMLQLPAWIEERPVSNKIDQDLEALDPGERDALSLAIALGADLILIDDGEGRRAAGRHNVRVTGTLVFSSERRRVGWSICRRLSRACNRRTSGYVNISSKTCLKRMRWGRLSREHLRCTAGRRTAVKSRFSRLIGIVLSLIRFEVQSLSGRLC